MHWLIEKWKIVEFYRTLPKNTKQISWLNKLTKKKLVDLWYFTVVWKSKILKDWQTYWNSTYTIKKKYIKEVKEIINTDLKKYQESKIDIEREKCRKLIIDEYDEDNQRNILMSLDNNEITEMNNKITTIRDDYNIRKNSIYICSTQEEVYNLTLTYNELDKQWDNRIK